MAEYKSIIVSGLPRAGKSVLVDALSKELGIAQASVGAILRKEHKIEDPNNDISFDDYFRKISKGDKTVMQEKLKPFLENGNIVVSARYVSSLLDTSACLLVFVTADLDIRAKRATEDKIYEDKSEGQIRKMLRKRELAEVRKGIALFNTDYRTPSLYHLVLNSGILTLKEERTLIKSLFKPS